MKIIGYKFDPDSFTSGPPIRGAIWKRHGIWIADDGLAVDAIVVRPRYRQRIVEDPDMNVTIRGFRGQVRHARAIAACVVADNVVADNGVDDIDAAWFDIADDRSLTEDGDGRFINRRISYEIRTASMAPMAVAPRQLGPDHRVHVVSGRIFDDVPRNRLRVTIKQFLPAVMNCPAIPAGRNALARVESFLSAGYGSYMVIPIRIDSILCDFIDDGESMQSASFQLI